MSWRRFAFHLTWFFGVQMPTTAFWQLRFPASWAKWGVFYIAELSVAALFLTALNWWAVEVAKDAQLTIETLVDETTLERS